MSSIHSNHKLDTSSIHQEALSHAGSKGIMGSLSQHLGNQSPSAGEVGYAVQGHDGYSTMGTNQKPKMKSITDVLNERIQAFVQKPDPTAGAENRIDYAGEFSQLKIENDLVNVFFDEIHRMSDGFTFNFIETLKQDIEAIVQTLF